jgi:hypothetical protein
MVVLATIALLGETALAFTAHVTCTCGHDGVSLPRDGAVNVPTNTRIWRLYRSTPPSGGPLPQLEPYTVVDLPSYYVRFTTGEGPDHVPPAKPHIGVLNIMVAGGGPPDRMDAAQLFIVGGFSTDTAVLRIRLFDGDRVITYYMAADHRLICEPGFTLHAGPIYAEVTAIDLAGNESPPAGFVATSALVTPFESPCPNPHISHYSPWHAQETQTPSPIPALTLVLDVVGGLVIAMAMSRRSRKRALATIEPLAITAAEQLARRVRLRSALMAIALVGAVAGLAPLDPRVASEFAIASPLLLWALWTPIASWWAATRLLRLAAHDGALSGAHHDRIVVALADRRASVACSRRLIVHAQQNALPTATSR